MDFALGYYELKEEGGKVRRMNAAELEQKKVEKGVLAGKPKDKVEVLKYAYARKVLA